MTGEALALYAFSYFDPIRRRWVKARYRATVEDIAARYPQFRLEGAPEIRIGGKSGFKPPTGSSQD